MILQYICKPCKRYTEKTMLTDKNFLNAPKETVCSTCTGRAQKIVPISKEDLELALFPKKDERHLK